MSNRTVSMRLFSTTTYVLMGKKKEFLVIHSFCKPVVSLIYFLVLGKKSDVQKNLSLRRFF